MTTPKSKTNAIGLSREEYKAGKSTLCPGCGHDSISNQIISMAFELGIEQHKIIKMSGIGCSSKTPAYFLGRSHGFNAIHGRMPSVVTGAHLANPTLQTVAVSGDGDTGSIGLGQFKHLMRRNVPMVYIIENNGVYGLTKGQFSATADEGAIIKYYGHNALPPIDLAMEAIVGGASFVARSFSGDAEQVRTLMKAAMNHRGTAVLDIISPCVTFNNDETSTKSYSYGKANEIPLHEIELLLQQDYIEPREEITIEGYEAGQFMDVRMHDGATIRLKKLDRDHNPRSKIEAMQVLEEAQRDRIFLTGLIYYEEPRPTLAQVNDLVDQQLASLNEGQMRPPREALEQVLAGYK